MSLPDTFPKSNFLQTHEPGLVDLYATVRNDGTVTVATGCPFTVTVPATNVLLFVLNTSVPIYSADLTNTTRTAAAYHSGVNKTFDIEANPMATWANGTGSQSLLYTFDTVASSPTINANGNLQFYVQFYGSLMTLLGKVGSVSGSTINLLTTGDSANFSVGQYVTAYASSGYGVPIFTREVASVGTGTVTMTAALPSGIDDFFIYNASTLYTNVSVQTSSGLVSQ